MPRNSLHANDGADLRRVGIHPDHWYPLAQSACLKRRATLGVTFAGEPIALVRTESGKIYALEDRCAHRQMPLHMGIVHGEHLKCCYHGWEYDETGRICRIPYLVKGGRRPPRGVRSYPCREAYGHIFVFPGDRHSAGKVPLPELPTWASPSHKTMHFSRQVNCHYSFMHENLMDMNHQFLHRKLMGSVQPRFLAYDKGDSWIEATYAFADAKGGGNIGGRFLAPMKEFVMTIRTDYPYQTLNVRGTSSELPAFNLWAAYVPVDREQRIHRAFGMLMIRKPRIAGAIYAMWPFMRYFTERVFAEDRVVVEAEQRAYDAQGADWNQEVFPVILDLRRILVRQGIACNRTP